MTVVLIASDKFKGSLTAAQVAAAVGEGVRRVLADVELRSVPVADGGDGTLAAALSAGFTEVPVKASGPTGGRVVTSYARQGDLAVVEMADVSGLGRLPGGRLEPMRATSRGTGEVIAAAVDAGCHRLVVGIGGSACTDGGTGLVQALGGRLLDASGGQIGDGGGSLPELTHVELTALRRRMADIEVVIACDVDNPLTGPRGAAAVYAPQKGADIDDVAALDRALAHWADLVAKATAKTAATLQAPAQRVASGSRRSPCWAPSCGRALTWCSTWSASMSSWPVLTLVVTGEGSLDEQTLHGKAPAGVAVAAGAAGVPVVAVCGRLQVSAEALREAGIGAAYALVDIEPDLQRCIDNAERLLQQLGEQVAADHLIRSAD